MAAVVTERKFDQTIHRSLLELETQLDGSGAASDNITQIFGHDSIAQRHKIALSLLNSSLHLSDDFSLSNLESIDLPKQFEFPLASSKSEWDDLIRDNLPEVSERFTLLREVGAGGMGVVYEVEDKESGAILAMKFLQRPFPEQLLSFKSEFRSLCHLAHPNLVRLFEFFHKDRLACFTMEYIEGTDILSWWKAVKQSEALPPYGIIRKVFLDLANGLHALHCDGKLHRDIKPSNVMVGEDNRVVILDFGLVTNYADHLGLFNIRDIAIGGTVPYMAPEQMSGVGELNSGGDWYAFGVLLYEILGEKRPFTGAYSNIIAQKEGELYEELPDSIPPDLIRLCKELMRFQSDQRPSFGTIRQFLDEKSQLESIEKESPTEIGHFLGREVESGILLDAFRKSMDGTLVLAQVHGSSGIGKTSLIDCFRKEVSREGAVDTLIFSGRCYEQESIPFKGMDEIVDQLAVYLANLTQTDRSKILPENFRALRSVFPAFDLVDNDTSTAIVSMLDQSTSPVEVLESFCELVSNLCKSHPVIFILDDLQWSDSGCINIVEFLLRHLRERRLLIVCSYRRDEGEQNEALSILKKELDEIHDLPHYNVPVDELDEKSLIQLALQYGGAGLDEKKVNEIIKESRGSPFFLMQLAGAVRKGDDTIDFKSILNSRLAELSSDERCFLELIATAGRPISRNFVINAAKLGGNEYQIESNLRINSWIKSSGPGSWDTLETYHDRIREGVFDVIAEDKKRFHHASLADSLEAGVLDVSQDNPDRRTGVHPAIIAHHFTQSDQPEKAIPFWRQASTDSMQRSAYSEAVAQADRGLELLSQLPSGATMVNEEFALCTTKATVLITTKGYSADEVGNELARASRLLNSLNDSVQQFSALCGLWVFTLMRSRLNESKEYAETLLRIAESENDSNLLIEAHWRLGATYYWFGDFIRALHHLQTAVDMYQPEIHLRNTYIYGQNPGVAARIYLTFVLCYAGDFERANFYQTEAMSIAEEIDHPHTMGWALGGSTMFKLGMGDFQGTIEVGNPTIEFCTEHSQGYWLVVANMLVGWAHVHNGDIDLGCSMIEGGFAAYQQMGAQLIQPFFYTMLADCSARKGDFDKAWNQIETGLSICDENMELNAKPGLLLAKAGLILRKEDPDFQAAENLLVEAMQMAESQGSKLRSLQATGALAKMYSDLGRLADANNLLTPVKAWLSKHGGKELEEIARQFLGAVD